MGMGATFRMPRVVQKVLAQASHTARTTGQKAIFHAGFKAICRRFIIPLQPYTAPLRAGPVKHKQPPLRHGPSRRRLKPKFSLASGRIGIMQAS